MKLEDEKQFVIVDKVTQELWSREVYLSSSGAKSSFYHASRYRRFDDQSKYEIIKVKLVRVDD